MLQSKWLDREAPLAAVGSPILACCDIWGDVDVPRGNWRTRRHERSRSGVGANNACVRRDEWKWRDASEWDCCQGYKADCDIRAASGDAQARLRSWIWMIPSEVDADDPKITILRLRSWLHMTHVRIWSRFHHLVKNWMTWAGSGHDQSLNLNCTFQDL